MAALPTSRALVTWLLAALAVAACSGSAATIAPDTGIRGTATAGPVCPVERNPPDPACAPRPVAGATIVVRDGSGAQAAVAISDAAGAYFVAVPPGVYVVDPQPVPGMLGTAPKQPATVVAGAVTEVPLDYDTGIR